MKCAQATEAFAKASGSYGFKEISLSWQLQSAVWYLPIAPGRVLELWYMLSFHEATLLSSGCADFVLCGFGADGV